LLWLRYESANKEVCRDCANLAVDLDWTALQISADVEVWSLHMGMIDISV